MSNSTQDTLAQFQSLDAMRLLNWRRKANMMIEQAERGSDMQKFVSESLRLVIGFVGDIERIVYAESQNNPEILLSDLLSDGGICLAIDNMIVRQIEEEEELDC